MLFVYLLIISLVVLLMYSLSREKGKNTKYARKGSNAIALESEKSQSFNMPSVIEVN